MEIGNALNAIRKQVFDDLISFHFTVKEHTNEDEWKDVMKAFNKELTISSH